MKDKKGFTLIELLAVLVILVGISMVAVMGISASLERRDEKELEEQIELAKNSAKIYFSLSEGITSVKISELVDNNYLDGQKVSKLDKDYCIKITSNKYDYVRC